MRDSFREQQDVWRGANGNGLKRSLGDGRGGMGRDRTGGFSGEQGSENYAGRGGSVGGQVAAQLFEGAGAAHPGGVFGDA